MLTFFLSSCGYFIKALIYQTANIDDYKIFPNNTVETEDPEEWKLHEDYNTQKLPKEKLEKIKTYKPVAFVVVKDKKIFHEQYWGGYNQYSLVNCFSATKSIVSLLMGIAIDEGKINGVEQRVGDFLPAYNEGQSKEITIKHLLTMSSGLKWKEGYASPFSVTTRAYYGRNLEKLINKLKVAEEPGKEYSYQSCNTQILSFIIEKATGKTISEYASEKLWKPLHAEQDALWSLDRKDGNEKAYCCFSSTARDFARIGQLILDDGKWNNKQIISNEYLEQALEPAKYLVDKESKKHVDFYGYHWWILHHKGHKIPYARGIMGQYIFIFPWENAVVVRLGHKRDKEYQQAHPKDVYLYVDAALGMLE